MSDARSFERCNPFDFSKLRIIGDRIHYRIYQQDGSMQAMDCADTRSNRIFVSLLQIHDRWLPSNCDLPDAAAEGEGR